MAIPKNIIVGPLLGFEGDKYTVCILTASPSPAPSIELPDLNIKQSFQKVARVGDGQFWRTEFAVPVLPRKQQITYLVKAGSTKLADAHDRSAWTFYVPAENEEPVLAYASCNGFSSAKLVRDTADPYALWRDLASRHKAKPYSLLLMGGDQVYADQIWEASPQVRPQLDAWNKLSYKEQNNAPVSAALEAEIESFYNGLYPSRWADASMSLMFASVPSVMMWDDHDIFDGWGSYPDERQSCKVFQAIFKHARRVFQIFQLRGSNNTRLDKTGAHFTLTVRFRNYDLLVLDNRSERTKNRIMSEPHWQQVKDWLAAFEGQEVKNLLVMSGIPVVYRSFATIETILNATPWQEEIEDDIHDHWTAKEHQAERMRLIMVLLGFLEKHRESKGVILSGDVHVGAVGQIWCERKLLGVTQIVSSGIVHPPPTTLQWFGIRAMTSDDAESLAEGEVETEMLTPNGSKQYLRIRNYVTLSTGTDKKLWANWVCEGEAQQPSFAIADNRTLKPVE